MNLLKTLLLSSAIIAGSTLSISALALSPFTAQYQFSYNGKNMGTATRQLKQQNNQWQYTFTAQAAKLASASETSRFTFNNHQIQSLNFGRSSKILVHNRSLGIAFSPSNKLITTNKDGKKRSFAWKAGALDELNVELQVREDLKRNALKSHYLITDAKEVEAHRFVRQGTEKVKTHAGTFDTIKIVLQHSNPKRHTTFWLAPSLDYVPVKVTHHDDGTSYGLNLTHYKNN